MGYIFYHQDKKYFKKNKLFRQRDCRKSESRVKKISYEGSSL